MARRARALSAALLLTTCACSDEVVELGVDGPDPLDAGAVRDAQGGNEASASVNSQPLKCVAGTYQGGLLGRYHSEPAGLCGVVAGPEEMSTGRWTFSLSNQGDGEFYVVRAGCVTFADVELKDGGTNYGQRAELIGKVDCNTGVLDAEMRGTYVSVSFCDLGQIWTNYFFKGRLQGRFDPATNRFVDATYAISERPPLLGVATGGSGTWTGSLVLDASAPNAVSGSCLGVDFPEDLAPRVVIPDAGK